MKTNRIIPILLLVSACHSEPREGFGILGFQATYDTSASGSFDLFKYSLLDPDKSGYYLECEVFPVSIVDDRFNDNKTNVSIKTLYQPLFGLLAISNKGNFVTSLASVINGKQGIAVKLGEFEAKSCGSTWTASRFLLLTATNNTDLFGFREKKWIRLTPGIGIGYLSTYMGSLQIGIDRATYITQETTFSNFMVNISWFLWGMGC